MELSNREKYKLANAKLITMFMILILYTWHFNVLELNSIAAMAIESGVRLRVWGWSGGVSEPVPEMP